MHIRLAEWHNCWGAEEAVAHLGLALEGTSALVLLDLGERAWGSTLLISSC